MGSCSMPKLLLNERKINQDFAKLTKRDANKSLYDAMTTTAPSVLVTPIERAAKHTLAPGYRLVRVDGREPEINGFPTFEIALLNDITQQVVYYNHVIITQVSDLNCRPASQMMVWRSSDQKHEAVLNNLANNVFFNYILERYDVILSDSSHTGQGQFFWKRQMSSALARGLYVYFYRMLEAQLEPILNQEALDELDESLWGEDDRYSHHLAIISRINLPTDLSLEILN